MIAPTMAPINPAPSPGRYHPRASPRARHEGADDAENGSENETGRLIIAGHNKLGDYTSDEANDDCPKDTHLKFSFRPKTFQNYAAGKRPSGVYLSTAVGNSRESLARSSSCESPVCCSSFSRTSDPIACFNC